MHIVISPPAMDLFPRWRTTSTVPFQLNSTEIIVGRSDRIKFVFIDYFSGSTGTGKDKRMK